MRHGSVEKCIANAAHDATYALLNINRTKLENLNYRIFDGARLGIEIKGRFGHPVVPREWFFVPLFAIDEAVERIKDGTIAEYFYDVGSAKLKARSAEKANEK